ncbi:hypothetical protein QYE76_064340 [Lolium multiflorum]|uniref:Uncharacterized protein n=1 Tax=Lolium multiflorum TaxID=4521 RepID=A0AAD8W913_LOLMU|nr:hypothetical protein QYE76_064340 [Lolium multiflorum]
MAPTWKLCDKVVMEQLQVEPAALATQVTKQGEDTSSALTAVRDSLKALSATNVTVCENIKGLNKWALAIDDSIRDLLKSVEEVGTCVAILETERGDDDPPRPDGHGSTSKTQGTLTHAEHGKAHTLVKGNAALWLQNVEAEEDVETWEELCVAVHAKIGDEEISPSSFTKPASSGKLADIFGSMSFGSSADSNISSDSESVDRFNFIDRSTSIREVFPDLYDGVTDPKEEDEIPIYHQVCAIGDSSRQEDDTSEAFDDLGNPYIDPADLTRGLGTKYIGTDPRQKLQLPQAAWDRASRAMDGTEPR